MKGETYAAKSRRRGRDELVAHQSQLYPAPMQLHTKGSSSDTRCQKPSRADSPTKPVFDSFAQWNFTGHFELDCGVRYVDSLANQNIPAYLALDVRSAGGPAIIWNLPSSDKVCLDDRHPEFRPTTIRRRPRRLNTAFTRRSDGASDDLSRLPEARSAVPLERGRAVGAGAQRKLTGGMAAWRYCGSCWRSPSRVWIVWRPRAETSISLEYQVQSRIYVHFAKYVEWPPKSFPEADRPFVIGLIARIPLGPNWTRC